MLRNGVMPIPPARNTAVRVTSLWRVRLPDGPSSLTAEPSGIVFNTRLNAVSRIRVATIRVSSSGPLAIENVRVFPSASVSWGSHKVISRDWPASLLGFAQSHIERLARLECPVRWLFKAECGRAFRDFMPAHELGQSYRRGCGSDHESPSRSASSGVRISSCRLARTHYAARTTEQACRR